MIHTAENCYVHITEIARHEKRNNWAIACLEEFVATGEAGQDENDILRPIPFLYEILVRSDGSSAQRDLPKRRMIHLCQEGAVTQFADQHINHDITHATRSAPQPTLTRRYPFQFPRPCPFVPLPETIAA